jgi:penicillin G amidase
VGFFERPDPRLAQSADPTPVGAIGRMLGRHAAAFGLCLLGLVAAYAANVAIGLREAATTRGSIAGAGLYAPVTIVRDRRDIPHVRARNDHDLYFAQGYVEGSDRLFQLDISRRFAYGRLAEVLGPKALPYDEEQRAVGIEDIARRQLRWLSPSDRSAIEAYSDGVNAALTTQPLPVEFRILLYRPAAWTPKDSLAVAVEASLQLSDSWHSIFARDSVWRSREHRCFDALFPLSDSRYDVTIDGLRTPPQTRSVPNDCTGSTVASVPRRPAIGSNAWAVGGKLSADGNALIANDPHIALTIPGIWYLIDLRSPRLHVAGATVPGIPGVALGHNERLAWASTNAAMATMSLFEAGRLSRGSWSEERFGVRFSHDVSVAYYRTAREFSVPDDNDSSKVALVRWPVYAQSRSSIATVLALDRAGDVRAALRILAQYRGSPQDFILADRKGEVAYHVAGLVPHDPAWGRYVHSAGELQSNYDPIPFERLPHRGPSRDAILLCANNKPYGRQYAYRLSAQFDSPYRAYRIAQLLRARRRYAASYFAQMQLDTFSPIDLEIARDVVRHARAQSDSHVSADGALQLLQRWDGRYRPASYAATFEHALRLAVFEEGPAFSERLRELRGEPDAPSLAEDISATLSEAAFPRVITWRDAGATRIEHLLAPMNLGFLNGAWLPGAGDEYTIHLQEPGVAQGFRAVWDVGNWNRGGIVIPSGESGEPGSGHYTDLTPAWIAGTLLPLPFSRGAVDANAASRLRLMPARR